MQSNKLYFVKKVTSMKKKTIRILGQVLTYSPLAGIIYASFLNLTAVQHQVLMILLLIWVIPSSFIFKTIESTKRVPLRLIN